MPESFEFPQAECAICGAEHDEAIHEATLSVHRWFRIQVTQYLFDEEIFEFEEDAVFQVA